MDQETPTTSANVMENTPIATSGTPDADPPTLVLAGPDPVPDTAGVEHAHAAPEQVESLPGPAGSPNTDAHESQDQLPEANQEPAAQTVPIARLQGVQRRLASTEAALQTANATIEALTTQVAEANRTAAHARIAEIRATHADIVPDLITGSTLVEVETSLQNSRRAFAAAQQAYARTIPVPQAGNPAQPTAHDQPNLSPLEMISAGLRQPKSDINK